MFSFSFSLMSFLLRRAVFNFRGGTPSRGFAVRLRRQNTHTQKKEKNDMRPTVQCLEHFIFFFSVFMCHEQKKGKRKTGDRPTSTTRADRKNKEKKERRNRQSGRKRRPPGTRCGGSATRTGRTARAVIFGVARHHSAHAKGTSPMSATARDRAAAATRPCLLQKTPSPSTRTRGTLVQPATWHASCSRLSTLKLRLAAPAGVG